MKNRFSAAEADTEASADASPNNVATFLDAYLERCVKPAARKSSESGGVVRSCSLTPTLFAEILYLMMRASCYAEHLTLPSRDSGPSCGMIRRSA